MAPPSIRRELRTLLRLVGIPLVLAATASPYAAAQDTQGSDPPAPAGVRPPAGEDASATPSGAPPSPTSRRPESSSVDAAGTSDTAGDADTPDTPEASDTSDRGILPDDDGTEAEGRRLPEKPIEIRLRLSQAVRIALEKNLDVRVARTEVRSRLYDVTGADAAFDPFFSLGADYSKNRRPTASFLDIGGGALQPTVQANPTEFAEFFLALQGLTPLGTSYTLRVAESSFDRPVASGTLFGINPQVSTDASLTLTQPLLKGAWYPYNTADVLIARNEHALALEQLEQSAIDTVFAVEQAYWDLAFALKNREAKAKALEVAEEDLENARRRQEAGTLAPIDVTIVESQAALRRVEFNEAELLLENSRDALLDLLNHSGRKTLRDRWRSGERHPPYDDILVIPETETDPSAFTPDRQAAIELAFERRPDYRQAVYRLRSQRLRVDVAENETLPQLDLTGSWTQHGLEDAYDQSISSLSSGDFYSWSVGVQLEVPIPMRGPRSAFRRARNELLRQRLEQARLENQVVLEVDQALRELRSIHARVKDLEDRVRLQEAILEAERRKLRAGRSISYTVSTIENDLMDSQAQALRARADYESARAAYYRATGTLLDRHGVEILSR